MDLSKIQVSFPNESQEYRQKRNDLLQLEIELKALSEKVAEKRRQLPKGGKLKENYIFQDIDQQGNKRDLSFTDLFKQNKNSLVIYSMMFAESDQEPCPSCNSLVDGFNGQSQHANDRINFVVIAKCSIEKLQNWAKIRNWNNLRLLSSQKNTYNIDYFAEDKQNGGQLPMLNVFEKENGEIYHFTSSEMLFQKSPQGQDARHVDLLWPIWNMFDFTREGRGQNWYPKIQY